MNDRRQQRRTTTRQESGPGAPAAQPPPPVGSSVPATREPPAPATSEENPIDVAAAFLAQKWGSLTRIGYTEFRKMGALVQSSFPEMGALEMVKFFDNLGGKPYDNAEFWLDQVAKHPATERPPELVPLKPGTPEWEEWIGESLGVQEIPAAYLCRLYRTDREGPFEEVGYATSKDAILYDYEWVEAEGAKSRADAAKMHPDADKLFEDREAQPRVWKARIPTPKIAYEGEAKKTARTRAIRRCAKRAYSLTEAKYIRVGVEVEELLEQMEADVTARELPKGQDMRAALQARFVCKHCEPPVELVATELEAHRKDHPGHNSFTAVAESSGAAPPPPAKAAVKRSTEGVRYISDTDHKRLHAWANERNLGAVSNPHETIKRIVADKRGLNDPAKVKTTEITYEEFEYVREELERFPLRPQDPEKAEEVQAEVVETRPGKAEQADLLDQ